MADLSPADYGSASGGETRVEFDPALNVLYLGINQAHAPWNHPECRQALAHALDRERYVREFFPGDAVLAQAMQPPAVWGHAPPQEGYDYDLARAQARWQACLAAGATLPASVTLYVPPIPRPYLPDPAGLGEALRADLAALGLTVEIAAPDWQTTWLADVHSGRADLFVLGWTGVNGDPDAFLCPLFCGWEGAFATDENGNPVAPDAELATLLQQARTETDPARREALYAQAHERVRSVVPAVPLAHRRSAWALRADVAGYTPSPIESVFWGLVRR
jgi:peptide/nickel transport system substrate-binding protein